MLKGDKKKIISPKSIFRLFTRKGKLAEDHETRTKGVKISETTSEDTSCDDLSKHEQSQAVEKIEADQKIDVSDQTIGGEYAGQKIGGSEELYAKIEKQHQLLTERLRKEEEERLNSNQPIQSMLEIARALRKSKKANDNIEKSSSEKASVTAENPLSDRIKAATLELQEALRKFNEEQEMRSSAKKLESTEKNNKEILINIDQKVTHDFISETKFVDYFSNETVDGEDYGSCGIFCATPHLFQCGNEEDTTDDNPTNVQLLYSMRGRRDDLSDVANDHYQHINGAAQSRKSSLKVPSLPSYPQNNIEMDSPQYFSSKSKLNGDVVSFGERISADLRPKDDLMVSQNMVDWLDDDNALGLMVITEEFTQKDLLITANRVHHDIIEKGDLETIQHLISLNEIDVNDATNQRGSSLLNTASRKGQLDIVRYLISVGANVNLVDLNGHTPVYSACDNGHEPVCRLLVANGGSVNFSSTNRGRSPLFVACMHEHLQIVELLLAHGAIVNDQSKKGETPLKLACNKGNVLMVKMLISAGADLSVKDRSGITALYEAAAFGFEEIVHYLISVGGKSQLEVKDKRGWTALSAASSRGHATIVAVLLSAGAMVNVQNEDEVTPLNAASSQGYAGTVTILLEHGADINLCDNQGWSPLNSAADEGHSKVVRQLLQSGADLNCSNIDSMTPFYSAALRGHSHIATMLLQANADYKIPHKNGWTPFIVACAQGNLQIVELLLQLGVNLEERNNEGWTALYAAAERNHKLIVKMLVEVGANMEHTNSHGWTPLHAASYNNNMDVVRILVKAGAHLEHPDNQGLTAVYAAAHQYNDEIVKMLVEAGAKVQIGDDDDIAPGGGQGGLPREPIKFVPPTTRLDCHMFSFL